VTLVRQAKSAFFYGIGKQLQINCNLQACKHNQSSLFGNSLQELQISQHHFRTHRNLPLEPRAPKHCRTHGHIDTRHVPYRLLEPESRHTAISSRTVAPNTGFQYAHIEPGFSVMDKRLRRRAGNYHGVCAVKTFALRKPAWRHQTDAGICLGAPRQQAFSDAASSGDCFVWRKCRGAQPSTGRPACGGRCYGCPMIPQTAA